MILCSFVWKNDVHVHKQNKHEAEYVYLWGTLWNEAVRKTSKRGKRFMEKFDYFREKTGKNLNYNHYSGKLTPGCERSVIKIPPKNVYRSKRLSSLFYLQNSDCFAF